MLRASDYLAEGLVCSFIHSFIIAVCLGNVGFYNCRISAEAVKESFTLTDHLWRNVPWWWLNRWRVEPKVGQIEWLFLGWMTSGVHSESLAALIHLCWLYSAEVAVTFILSVWRRNFDYELQRSKQMWCDRIASWKNVLPGWGGEAGTSG